MILPGARWFSVSVSSKGHYDVLKAFCFDELCAGYLGVKDGVFAAIKADTLSLTAFEVGLFGWMALTSFVFFNHQLHPDSPVYWFMMQSGMVIGFATSYPMNWWLISKGIKDKEYVEPSFTHFL